VKHLITLRAIQGLQSKMNAGGEEIQDLTDH